MLTKDEVKQVATIEQITVKDARKPGGKTARKHREKITQCEMTFPESGSLKLTALDRVKMLKALSTDATDPSSPLPWARARATQCGSVP